MNGVAEFFRERALWITVVGAVLAAAILGGVSLLTLPFRDDPESKPSPPVIMTTTAAPPPVTAPEVTDSPTPSVSDSPSPAPASTEPAFGDVTPEPAAVYLSDADPVRNNGPYDTGRFKTGRRWYDNSVQLCGGQWADCMIAEDPPIWVDYDVGSGQTRIVAAIGLSRQADADCEQRARVILIAQRRLVVFDKVLRFGYAYRLEAPLGTALRVRLEAPKAYHGDVCPVVFGNARLEAA